MESTSKDAVYKEQTEEYIESDLAASPTNYDKQTKLYPNPASDFLNIKIAEKTGVGNLMIFDQTGRILFKKDYQLNTSSNIQIDVSDYSPGILFFIYKHNEKRSLYKIIKK